MSKMCNCIDEANKGLAEKNVQLDLAFNVRGDVRPQIVVEKIDRKVRGKVPMLLPSFCPFCGEKYPELKEKRR